MSQDGTHGDEWWPPIEWEPAGQGTPVPVEGSLHTSDWIEYDVQSYDSPITVSSRTLALEEQVDYRTGLWTFLLITKDGLEVLLENQTFAPTYVRAITSPDPGRPDDTLQQRRYDCFEAHFSERIACFREV